MAGRGGAFIEATGKRGLPSILPTKGKRGVREGGEGGGKDKHWRKTRGRSRKEVRMKERC